MGLVLSSRIRRYTIFKNLGSAAPGLFGLLLDDFIGSLRCADQLCTPAYQNPAKLSSSGTEENFEPSCYGKRILIKLSGSRRRDRHCVNRTRWYSAVRMTSSITPRPSSSAS